MSRVSLGWVVLACAEPPHPASQPQVQSAAPARVAPKETEPAIEFEQRAFVEMVDKSYRTALQPWPAFTTPHPKPEFERLRLWLVDHPELRTWPPRVADRKEGRALVASYLEEVPHVEALTKRAEGDWPATLLVATFYVYGHHLDEPGAGERAYELLEAARRSFPDLAEPSLAAGLHVLTSSPSRSPLPYFREALERAKTEETRALAELGWGSRCGFVRKKHGAVLHYARGLELGGALEAELRKEYGATLRLARDVFTGDTTRVHAPHDIFGFEEQSFSSSFYGATLRLPEGWQVDKADRYEPGYLSNAVFDAPVDEESGLVHGMHVSYDARPAGAHQEHWMLEAMKRGGATVRPIQPLSSHPELSHWFEYRTQDRVVGTRVDTISGYYAEGLVLPRPFTRADHEELAKLEGECDSDELAGPPPPDGHVYYLQAGMGRVDRPVRFVITFNASARTLAKGKSTFVQILKDLRFEARSGTDLLGPGG